MLNVGIIGPGRVAERHAGALKEVHGAQLWSVCGRNLSSAEVFAKKQGAVAQRRAFADFAEMLADPKLDAVIIATPDGLHAEQMQQAAGAKKAIFVEKPLCTSLLQMEEIARACQSSSSLVAVGYYLRWHAGLRKISTCAKTGQIGDLKQITMRWAVDFRSHAKWRTDPAYGKWFCLSVLGTHMIDIARWIMTPQCGDVVEINSSVKSSSATKVDEEAEITLHFQSGAVAEIFCSVIFDAPFDVKIVASGKSVLATNITPHNKTGGSFLVGNETIHFLQNNPYAEQLTDFVQAIRENRKPEVPLEEGLKNVQHLLTIYEPEAVC